MQLLVSHLQVDGENFNRVCGIRAKFSKQKIVILLRIERSAIQAPKNSDLVTMLQLTKFELVSVRSR